MSDDDDNVSTRFGPKRFVARHTGEAKKAKAYKRAPKQERDTAARLGGMKTPASGARFKKGDVFVPNVARIECKCTGADSFRVTREMVDKIEAAGLLSDEIPYIEVEFLTDKGASPKALAVLSASSLTTLLNRLRDAEARTGSDTQPAEERRIGRAERNHRRRSPFHK